MELPTYQVGSADASLVALYVAIAVVTLFMISPAGWRYEAAREKSPKQVYPMCQIFQKATLPRVVKATSRNIPHVFSPLRILSRWMGRGLGMTSPLRSLWSLPFVTITLPLLPPLPPDQLSPPSPHMVRDAGGGSAAANASAARLPARTVRRSWRDLGSARPVYRP